MNNFYFLLKLTESDKRMILMFVLVIIAALSLLILLSLLIAKIGKTQAKRIDTLMHDAVVTGVVTSKKQFIKVASKKNHIYFYRHARPAMWILTIWAVATVIFCFTFPNKTPLEAFVGIYTDYETFGLATLFPIYDLSNPIVTDFFGWFEIVTGYGEPISTPHFSINALFAYISVPVMFVGGFMYMFQVEGLIARTIRIYRLAHKIYSKNLDNVKYNALSDAKYHDGAITIEETKVEQKVEQK